MDVTITVGDVSVTVAHTPDAEKMRDFIDTVATLTKVGEKTASGRIYNPVADGVDMAADSLETLEDLITMARDLLGDSFTP